MTDKYSGFVSAKNLLTVEHASSIILTCFVQYFFLSSLAYLPIRFIILGRNLYKIMIKIRFRACRNRDLLILYKIYVSSLKL